MNFREIDVVIRSINRLLPKSSIEITPEVIRDTPSRASTINAWPLQLTLPNGPNGHWTVANTPMPIECLPQNARLAINVDPILRDPQWWRKLHNEICDQIDQVLEQMPFYLKVFNLEKAIYNALATSTEEMSTTLANCELDTHLKLRSVEYSSIVPVVRLSWIMDDDAFSELVALAHQALAQTPQTNWIEFLGSAG